MSKIAAVIFLCHARVICARLKKTGSDGWDPRGSERKEEKKKGRGARGWFSRASWAAGGSRAGRRRDGLGPGK